MEAVHSWNIRFPCTLPPALGSLHPILCSHEPPREERVYLSSGKQWRRGRETLVTFENHQHCKLCQDPKEFCCKHLHGNRLVFLWNKLFWTKFFPLGLADRIESLMKSYGTKMERGCKNITFIQAFQITKYSVSHPFSNKLELFCSHVTVKWLCATHHLGLAWIG